MNLVAMTFIAFVAGWIVNVVADTLPERRSLRVTWATPFALLPKHIYQRLGLSHTISQPPARRYLLTFVAAIGLGWLAFRQEDEPIQILILAIHAWFFLTITIIDLEHRLVLNRMLLFALPFVLFSNLFNGSPNLPSMLLGGVVGFGFFLLLALLAPGALGMGDVKLAGFIGLITGLSGVVDALFLGILAGGIAGVVVLVGNRFQRGRTIAYAPYLVIGIWFFLFNIVDIVHLYWERL